MSGFDFDALRDPDAPLPDALAREGVHIRARQLRARTRRNRVATSATSIVAVVAIVLGVVAVRHNSGPSLQVQGPTSTTASSIHDRFVPPTTTENGIVTVPVTLPDGETLTMQYPQKLRIAQLGFSGAINVKWPVSGGQSACCGSLVTFSYTTIARVFGAETPIKVYEGANGGRVPFLQVPPPNFGGPDLNEQDLAFQFGPWLVRVGGGRDAPRLTDQQRATWAKSLTGTLDPNGYLVLHARAPLSIGEQVDSGFNSIGVGTFVRLTAHSDNRAGRLTCGAGQSDDNAHRSRSLAANGWRGYSWCVGTDLHVEVGGSRSFTNLANRQLRIGALTAPSVNPSPANTTAPSSVDDRFVPPTSMESGAVVLPVTLPDGETFTMRYPPSMKIAQLGFAGGGGVVGFSGASSRQVSISYTTIARAYGAQRPIAVYRNADNQEVPLYAGGKEPTLVFQFGPWLVRVSDTNPMTQSELATWARGLTGTPDASGYLVLHAQSPLTVANWFDGGFGSFTKGNSVELANHLYCGQPESDKAAHRRFRNGDGTRGVSWCDGDLHVSVSGAPSFVDLADHQLTVSATTPPVGPTPTFPSTTTAPPATSIPPAESATFVSPSQGWVLEKNGRVDATTDAGAHWRVASAITIPGPTSKIRFADATHGFAFGFVPNGGAPLWSTTDGGVHWAALKVPFSDVFDLAISRGVVYVVAQQQNNSDFRIWSAPADTLAWTEDPLVIPPGAGPVPSIQLVLAGSNGWLVEVDRVISGGARLSTSGRWIAWNPPSCGEGPGELAASSSTDVVMACNEGVWGGNLPHITPTVYFSHDGGTTFSRQLAPLNGLVTSPNPRTAVIGGGDTVQRTTDEGVHWNIVADVHDPSAYTPTDIGFTTTTQGFVILGDGQMLMTYDAGATWQRARLP